LAVLGVGSDGDNTLALTEFLPTASIHVAKGAKVQNEFRVTESATGYRVELCRNGKPYVTFMDGLTREGAEREARSLMALWAKISVSYPMREGASAVEKIVTVEQLHNGRHARIGDWT
jgi:hypothetical protein